MKKYVFFLSMITIGLFNHASFSQDLNSLKDASFIFKGRVVQYTPFKNENDLWMIAYSIEIKSIYKGDDLKLDTVILIAESVLGWSETEDGPIPNISSGYTHEEENKFALGPGITSILFCNLCKDKGILNKLPQNIQIYNSVIKTNNIVILEPICKTRNCYFYYYINKQSITIIKGFGKEYSTEEEFIEYLKKESIISSDKIIKKKDVEKIKSETYNINEHKIDYAQRLKNYNSYMEHLQIRMQNAAKYKTNSCKEFFISEYIDGPNKNKVLEIYNPSDSIKSLNGYSIKIFQNGAPTPLEIQLQGNVNPKGTYVISHPNADAAILANANQTSNKMNFDGNDAVVLNQGISNYIDKIGEIGVNPGNSGWNVPPSGSTKAHDLRRKFPIDKGETDWNQGKNQYDVLPQDSIQNIKQHQNVCAALLTNDITFSFANPIETGTSPRYFEFDVMVEANNNSTYFDYCLLRIAYNTSAFGSNLVANNKIIITKGSTYNDVSYTNPDTMVIDQASSILGVPFGTYFDTAGTWNRTLVTTTPIQMLHFKIEIQNCNQFSDIYFTDISFTPLFSHYTVNATENTYFVPELFYDNTYYQNNLNQELCPPPIITNMYPNPITSGTNSVLTIQGFNFGNTRDTGQVWMFNDEYDYHHDTIKHFDYIDYVPASWSDTEIKFIVPSIVDTLFIDGFEKGVGSGNVIVMRSDGVKSTPNSVSHLEVSYANTNVSIGYNTPAYQKIPLRVIADFGDTTKYFYLDTSITNLPDREFAVRTALSRWSCNTLINWTIKDTIIAQHFEDDFSVIYMDDSFHGNPLAKTMQSMGSTCTDDNGNKVAYYKDIDIGISRDFSNITATSWIYDTSYTQDLLTKEQDYFAVAQHEFGHAHSLNHVNDNTDIMYYASIMGPVYNFNRLDIYSSPDAVNGGNYIFQKSQQIHSCSFITQMIPFSTSNCTPYSINELFNKVIYIQAYPNPIDEVLNVSYSLKRNTDIRFSIYDFMGKLIMNYYAPKQIIGTHNIEFDFNDVKTGMYFLMVDFGFKKETIKLIKM